MTRKKSDSTTFTVRIGASAPLVPKGKPWLAPAPHDVSYEMRLVKAAALYADQVVLVSPSVVQVQHWERVAAGKVDDLELMVAYLGPHWVRNEGGLALPSREIAIALAEGYMAKVERSPSWVELRRATNSGTLVLGDLPVLSKLGFHPGTVLGALIGFLADSLDPKTPYVPLLDTSVTAAFNAAASTGIFHRGFPEGAREIAAATHLIGTLEAFPHAPFDVVLDVRKELEEPLVSFRGAVADLAREIDALPTDETFTREADAAYRRVVAPKLAELEHLTKARRIRSVLREEVATGGAGAAVKAGLAFAATQAAAWPQVAQAAVGALVAAADVAGGAYKRQRDIEDQRRANKLVWLYELERRLKPGH